MIGSRAAQLMIVAALAGAAGTVRVSAQDPHAPEIHEGVDYKVYGGDGAVSSVSAILQAAALGDVLLVGEEHDDLVGHRLELELLNASLERFAGSESEPRRSVVLSLEMFEQDVQLVLDEYLGGLITEDHFTESARAWNDYGVYYRPLVEAAKSHGAAVVAANAPRRYVNRVANEGPDALWDLSAEARSYLPPLPFPGPSDQYRAEWDEVMAEAMATVPPHEAAADTTAEAHGHAVSPNAIYAQALWDASMGYAITEALVRNLGAFVLHVAGSFHVAMGTGIPERIADYHPGTRVLTVVMTKVDDIAAWSADEHAGLADFVILTRK